MSCTCLSSTGWNNSGGRSKTKNTNTIAPMNKMKNCTGIFATALNSRLSRLWPMDLPVR